MNRILSFGLAAVTTTLLAQPVYADRGGHGGGGGGRAGGGGGGHVSAPAVHVAPTAHVAPAAHASVARNMRAPSVPHVATQAQAQFQSRSFVNPRSTFTPSVAQTHTRVRPQGNAPSIAFGGHAIDKTNPAVNTQNARTFAGPSSTTGRGSMAFRPTTEVSRDWDRGHMHAWNHHHYRWFNGDWVIVDGGFYDSPYGYYGGDGYPDVSSAPTYSTTDVAGSDSIAAGVQEQLTRLGYSPGPVDGVFGAQTRDAIVDFQNDHHLPVTGQIDGPLLRALGM